MRITDKKTLDKVIVTSCLVVINKASEIKTINTIERKALKKYVLRSMAHHEILMDKVRIDGNDTYMFIPVEQYIEYQVEFALGWLNEDKVNELAFGTVNVPTII